jgi:hypothetical protein
MPLSASRLAALAAVLLAIALVVTAAALALGSAGWDTEMIRTLRAPRVAAAAGVGALLALSGLAMQSLLRNPLADPYVLGTSGGAASMAPARMRRGDASSVVASARRANHSNSPPAASAPTAAPAASVRPSISASSAPTAAPPEVPST